MSSADLAVPAARAPTRDRGRRRVTSILDAGADVLAEKGFAAATMTEIAARSHTAIGSLYRFFPTKDALAEALAQRFSGEVADRLDAIEALAATLPPADVADALVDLMLDLRRDRAAVIALMDVRGDPDDRRTALRERMTRGLAAILRAAGPRLDAARVAVATHVLLYLLKGVPRLADGTDAAAARLAELRTAIRLYLAHSLA